MTAAKKLKNVVYIYNSKLRLAIWIMYIRGTCALYFLFYQEVHVSVNSVTAIFFMKGHVTRNFVNSIFFSSFHMKSHEANLC
jgi:hypothetical protein